jgi:rubredoxin
MVDEKKRRFLKHLAIVSGAGVFGLAVAQGSTLQAESLIDSLEEAEQQRGYRIVWATRRDKDYNIPRTYAEYLADAERLGIWECARCNFIYDVTEGRETRFDDLPPDWVCTACEGATREEFEQIGIAFRSGGQPLVNEVACAFHYDKDADGVYEASEEGVFCTMPCRTICPVTAIEKGAFSTLEGGKIGPNVDFDTCIGCGRCHKICGYNCIEWVNVPYEGKNKRVFGGGG